MIELGQHAQFIVWAYLGVGLGLIGLIALTLLDARRVARRLTELGDPRQER